MQGFVPQDVAVIEIIAVCCIGYIIGSISFAVAIGRYYGVNILKKGSKNAGATNVARLLGKQAGQKVFILDFLKGAFATGWPLIPYLNTTDPISLSMLGLTFAVIGHTYSLFLKFKGGKAVAVAMGGLFVMLPFVTLVSAAVWFLVFRLTRYVSLASLCFAITLPIGSLIFNHGWREVMFVLALCAFILVRHNENIRRLLNGTENRFKRKQSHEHEGLPAPKRYKKGHSHPHRRSRSQA